MIRVAYLSGATIPSMSANSMHVMKMCQAMVQEGMDVRLFGFEGQDFQPNVDIWNHYGVSSPFPMELVSPRGPASHYRLAMRAVWSCKSDFQPHLVFARHLPSAVIAAVARYPVIFETHHVPAGRLQPRLFRNLARSVRLERVIVITSPLRTMLLEKFADVVHDDAVLVAPDGVDLEQFDAIGDAPTCPYLLPDERLVATYAGHLYPGRGLELVLAVAEQLPEVRFVIVGGRPEDVEIWRARVHQARLKNVTLTGFVPNAAVPRHLKSSDVLLMPYQTRVGLASGGDTAGWMSPLKMFEYLAAGRLILSSDLPVLREILSDANAVLLPPDEPQAWVAAIRRALDDPAWRQRLGERAGRDAEQFTWRRRVQACMVAEPSDVA